MQLWIHCFQIWHILTTMPGILSESAPSFTFFFGWCLSDHRSKLRADLSLRPCVSDLTTESSLCAGSLSARGLFLDRDVAAAEVDFSLGAKLDSFICTVFLGFGCDCDCECAKSWRVEVGLAWDWDWDWDRGAADGPKSSNDDVTQDAPFVWLWTNNKKLELQHVSWSLLLLFYLV